MTAIIMNPTSDSVAEAREAQVREEAKRIEECKAMFAEALRRYKTQRDHVALQMPGVRTRTDQEIIDMALKTLKMNGYTNPEIVAAMTGRA